MDKPTLIARIANGRTEAVHDLLDAGGSPQDADEGGTSVLHWCAYYGDTSVVRLLLQHGASLDALGSDLGLDAAAFHGHWQLCQFLLQHGAPVQGTNGQSGETPLHAALCTDDRVRHDAVLKVLLAAGADPNARTIAGVETGAFMRDVRTRGETPLHRAAACGTVHTVELLLAAGANRELRDAHGDSALSWASWHRRPVEILRLLCFGEHRIHPGYRDMRANLAGNP